MSLPMTALARALCPDEPTLHAEVELALRDPHAFFDAHRRRLALRGISKPVPDLGLVALLDGLIARGLATELDWREDPEDVVAQVFSLGVLPSRLSVARAELPEAGESCQATLSIVAEVLRASGVVVAVLDRGSDSYPTVLVDARAYAHVEEIGRACGVALSRDR